MCWCNVSDKEKTVCYKEECIARDREMRPSEYEVLKYCIITRDYYDKGTLRTEVIKGV